MKTTRTLGILLFIFSFNTASAGDFSPPIVGGQDVFSHRIVGGQDSFQGEVEFIVSLQVNGNQHCGGSLVAPNWVLTAAHCVAGFRQPDSVVVGTHDLGNLERAERFEIEEMIVHPLYNIGARSSHDFALVKMTGHSLMPTVEMNYDDVTQIATDSFTVAGWGATFEGSFQDQDILQRLDLPLVEQSVCEEQFQNLQASQDAYLDDSMFCAGYAEGQQDACQGDSGGPIYYWDKETQSNILLGVVSWGIGCARENLSGVYGNVSVVTDWVEGEIFTTDIITAGI